MTSRIYNSDMEQGSREAHAADIHEACRLGDLPAIRQAFHLTPSSLNSHDSSVPST